MEGTSFAPMAGTNRRRGAISLGQCAGRSSLDRPRHARFQREAFLVVHAQRTEKTIPMRRAIHVRGRVTDRETGRPITAFTLVPGYTWDKVQNVWWENEREKELTGLAYDVHLSTEAGLRVIRIEAEGYLPEISRQVEGRRGRGRGPFRLA